MQNSSSHRRKKTAEYSTLYYSIKKNAFHVFGNLRGRVRRRLHADVRLRFAESAFVSPWVLSFFFFFHFFFFVFFISSSRFRRVAQSRLSFESLTRFSLSLFYVHKTRDVIIIRTTRITEPQLHAGFAVAGAFTAEWLVQKEQSLQKEVDALVSERRERNKEFKQQK